MPTTEREGPFLTLATRRISNECGTSLVVECLELGFGVRKDVTERGEVRLIECLMQHINTDVAGLAANDFIDPRKSPQVIETAQRIHHATISEVPISRLFRKPNSNSHPYTLAPNSHTQNPKL
ncbi:hypothetical protein A2165_02985 [Candidatus Curtissbacteria bacterium RBG_13_40_7]|uniref:Uncharacterized protein n=1 Tax=Candidatus Curtissbacteria bacterium RBG_13_40_7 TaxID=1797706 RepID=A0A1F5FVI3_9BACT|nr:MAG: hypothetical protein A2165_02985 [Candidatus Curtissbacteria bacterium RBG_13_40_7]